MKKIVLVVALALGLAGCGTLKNVGSAVGSITQPFQTPISKQTLNTFENGMIVAFAGLNAYKKACVRGAIDASCKAKIRRLQVYTRQIPSKLKIVRGYVDRGDQTNAIATFQTLQALWNSFKAEAAANNVGV